MVTTFLFHKIFVLHIAMRAVRLATVHIRLASITNQAPQILSQTIIMALTMFFSMDQLQPA
jgi:hypothetical protein